MAKTNTDSGPCISSEVSQTHALICNATNEKVIDMDQQSAEQQDTAAPHEAAQRPLTVTAKNKLFKETDFCL